MKKFLYNITSGYPKKLLPALFWSTLESFGRLVPAIIGFYGIRELFFANQLSRPIDTQLYLYLGIASILWFIFMMLLSRIVYDTQYTAAYDVSAQGRTDLANHLGKLSLGYLDTRDPGDLTTMMLGDYALVEQSVSHLVPQALSALVVLTFAFFSLGFLNWPLTLSIYATLPLVVLIVHGTNVFQRILGQRHIRAKVDSASRLQEYLQGIKEIKAYSLGGTKFSRLEEAFNRLRRESIRIEGFLGPIMLSALSLLRASTPILVFFGAYLLGQGKVTDLIFLIFVIVATRIYDPFTTLLINYAEFRYSLISAERIMEVRHQPIVPGEFVVGDDYTIEFKDVKFAYNETPVLHNIQLSLQPRTMTALVGPSGCGKSTIVKLIARFYDLTQGSITLGGTDLRSINPDDLYRHLSMVFQDVYLFKDTVLNNIRIGNQEASHEEIIEAAKKAQCHDFIMAMPQGYDTMIGEGGSTLSGGEKQRISIARAFLKQAKIILLDEATAALDLENEAAVQHAISELVQDKTVVVIAHRLKTIMGADTIVVLDRGSIVGTGSHPQLYETCDLYRNLVDMQDQAREWTLKAV
jgi:ATP-binding cassette subfamily B protein IrtB